jgi:SIR2-like domain
LFLKFLENGADIPDELIRAVNEGTAIFLCGAGVSMRAHLPDFKTLTERIYTRLGETWANEPAERNAVEAKQYDRALRALEKRTHFPKTASRVRSAVAELLGAPSCALPDHLAIVQLSRDAEGRPKLLTTNFDTLFERAAAAGGFTDVPSHAGKSIPKPGGERDFGILHIHGRNADVSLGLTQSDLVLTSADFGDAYLRDGWASQYIEDRMRLGTLVLVGYSAEDAAMRLLLETLDADRDRFRDLKNIYAIERGTQDSAALWKAKGITPIEFKEFDDIYHTLAEWARYAMDPVAYQALKLSSILTTSVSVVKP